MGMALGGSGSSLTCSAVWAVPGTLCLRPPHEEPLKSQWEAQQARGALPREAALEPYAPPVPRKKMELECMEGDCEGGGASSGRCRAAPLLGPCLA